MDAKLKAENAHCLDTRYSLMQLLENTMLRRSAEYIQAVPQQIRQALKESNLKFDQTRNCILWFGFCQPAEAEKRDQNISYSHLVLCIFICISQPPRYCSYRIMKFSSGLLFLATTNLLDILYILSNIVLINIFPPQ